MGSGTFSNLSPLLILYGVGAHRDNPFQLVQERSLPLQDPDPSLGQRKPLGAVDLGKFAHLPRPRRPLQLEHAAADRGRVAVSLDRPGVDDLARFLAHRRERDEFALELQARLLPQLALRRGERILHFPDLALRDSPRARVLLRPERSARMREQDLEISVADAVDQDSCAFRGHAVSSAAMKKNPIRAVILACSLLGAIPVGAQVPEWKTLSDQAIAAYRKGDLDLAESAGTKALEAATAAMGS